MALRTYGRPSFVLPVCALSVWCVSVSGQCGTMPIRKRRVFPDRQSRGVRADGTERLRENLYAIISGLSWCRRGTNGRSEMKNEIETMKRAFGRRRTNTGRSFPSGKHER